jgi:plastocyanin
MKLLSLPSLLVAVAVLAGCGSSSSSSDTGPNPGKPLTSVGIGGPPTGTTGATSTPASTGTTSTGTSTGSTSASGGGADKVSIKNLSFSPATVNAKVGDTITWTNNDSPPHNVTYTSGPKFTSSGTLNPGQSFSLKITSAMVGTIQYHCSIHPFMKATIVVTK